MHREGQQSVKLRHRVKGCQRVFRAPLRLLQGCGGSTPGGRAGAYFFLRREYDCQAHCGVRGAKAEILRLSYDMQIAPFWPFLRVFENPSRQASAGKNDRWVPSKGLINSPTTMRTQRRRRGAHIYRSSKTAAHNLLQQRFAVLSTSIGLSLGLQKPTESHNGGVGGMFSLVSVALAGKEAPMLKTARTIELLAQEGSQRVGNEDHCSG
jgi:hypothetical protein